MSRPHDTAAADLTSSLYVREVADLHEQIAWLRREKSMLADVNIALSRENVDLERRLVDAEADRAMLMRERDRLAGR